MFSFPLGGNKWEITGNYLSRKLTTYILRLISKIVKGWHSRRDEGTWTETNTNREEGANPAETETDEDLMGYDSEHWKGHVLPMADAWFNQQKTAQMSSLRRTLESSNIRNSEINILFGTLFPQVSFYSQFKCHITYEDFHNTLMTSLCFCNTFIYYSVVVFVTILFTISSQNPLEFT